MKADDVENGLTKLPDGGELAYQIHGREHAGIPVLLIRPLGGSMAQWVSVLSWRMVGSSLRVICLQLTTDN